MLATLHQIFGTTYGLDWGVLAFGLFSTILMTNGHIERGMKISLITCACGLSCALLTGQHGFVVYNILLIAINARGLMRGDRRGIAREVVQVANSNVISEAVPVRVSAR